MLTFLKILKVAIRPMAKGSITQEFWPTGVMEAALECEIHGQHFKLTEYKDTDKKIICSCSNRFCLPMKSQIEKKFENNSWYPISSWTTQYIEMFQITALKNNGTSYRCVFQFDDRFRNEKHPESGWDNSIIVVWLTVVFLVVMVNTLPVLYSAMKRTVSRLFLRGQQAN